MKKHFKYGICVLGKDKYGGRKGYDLVNKITTKTEYLSIYLSIYLSVYRPMYWEKYRIVYQK